MGQVIFVGQEEPLNRVLNAAVERWSQTLWPGLLVDRHPSRERKQLLVSIHVSPPIVERQVRVYHSRPHHPSRTIPSTTVSEIMQTQSRSILLSVYFDIRMTEHDPGCTQLIGGVDLIYKKTATCGKIE